MSQNHHVLIQCHSQICKAIQTDLQASHCFSCGAPLSNWSYIMWLREKELNKQKEVAEGGR